MKKGKKYMFPVWRFVCFLALIALFCLVILYLFAALGRPYLGGETVFDNSDVYHFSQQPVLRLITVSKMGKPIFRFFFYPQVFAAWIDAKHSRVFLVTSDTGRVDGAQGLYVYDGKHIKKVYQARNVAFENGEKSPGRIYVSWLYPPMNREDYEKKLAEKKKQMHNTFTLSPDGRYLFGYESGYEGGTGFTIDLSTLEKIPPTIEAPGEMKWNTDFTCAIGPAYGYGDEQWVELLYYDQNELRVRSYTNQFWASEFVDVVWSDGCEGVITLDTEEHDRTGMTIGRHNEYYRFSKDNEKLTRISSYNKHAYKAGKQSPQIVENLFFTIQTPKGL